MSKKSTEKQEKNLLQRHFIDCQSKKEEILRVFRSFLKTLFPDMVKYEES